MESNQLDCQIWRLYDLLHRTSIFCESMEECEHLVSHFVDTETDYAQSVSPADEIKFIKDDDIVSPLGYECIVYIDETYNATEDKPYKCSITRSKICHYIYYRDRDEEQRRKEAEKELKRKHPWILPLIKEKVKEPPKLTLDINGETLTFIPEDAPDWYPF